MKTAARLVAALALAGAVPDCAASPAPVTAKAVPPAAYAGMDCELHVWVLGRPNFVPKSNLMIRFTPPSAAQLADPYSTVNVFSAVKRAEALSEVQLAALFPGARSVSVVRHAEVIDMDVTPLASIKAPIKTGGAACYGDLVLANIYAIFPNPDAPYVQYGVVGGLVASAIAGGDRLVMDFWLQQWPGGKGGKPFTARRKNDSPLPHVQPGTPAYLDAARASADLNLASFAATVNARRKP